MSFSAEIGSPEATSYVTIAEADAYLASRDGFDIASWTALSEANKQFRLNYGALLLDSLNFRGVKATKNQALAFPRLYSESSLYVEAVDGRPMPFEDWQALVDYAGLKGVDVPSIPAAVKTAQVELAFQVVHNYIVSLEPFGEGEQQISDLGIDVIKIGFGSAKSSSYSLFSKEQLSAISSVKLMLRPFLTTLRASLI